ncbi:MAG TPA: asparagine synthase (glutamine-hydrolyzing) [Sphingomicrobium sp.]|nr:asparagine synthase (glutamine-hydrolyzing) [Sphingomicrobium sp.]
MCGIFAAVGPQVSERTLEHVFGALHHRGPDGRGQFVDQDAHLTIAHTRLAIIDLVTGDQPMESEDGSIVLSVNGEIYDFERIRSALEAKGYRFKTKSDSEVIIYLYREYGLGCFEHLRGEFAFLLYDKAKRLLVAARDRFGIKPLYCSRTADRFVFASEMKAIFASGLVEAKLNVEALDPFLEQDPEHARFPFENIGHVPPASYMAVNLDTLEAETTRYWSDEIPAESAAPVPEPFGDAPAKAARTVLEQLEEAVRLRLRADVPVGLYLSGGIDSAFVGALMKRNLNAELHSFSIAFVGSGRNEQEFAARAADVIGTEHHELAVTKQALWDNLERCLWFSELPFVTLAPVGKFLLSELARQKVTVVLTGEGADEVFLGYRSFFQKAIRDTRSGGRGASAQRRRLKVGGLIEKLSLRIFHKSHRNRLASARIKGAARPDASKPLINAVQEARIAAMPFDILAYLGDREEMAHSLEARLPFLDHHLYDAAKPIPVDFKMRDGVEKAVLRDAAEGILPDDLRMRRKSGFMLTSDAVDFFGADRAVTEKQRQRYLSKQAFARSAVFSYRAYKLASTVARLPASKRLRRLRRNANKVIMYMMQTHMLHEMFVADPPWKAAVAANPA